MEGGVARLTIVHEAFDTERVCSAAATFTSFSYREQIDESIVISSYQVVLS